MEKQPRIIGAFISLVEFLPFKVKQRESRLVLKSMNMDANTVYLTLSLSQSFILKLISDVLRGISILRNLKSLLMLCTKDVHKFETLSIKLSIIFFFLYNWKKNQNKQGYEVKYASINDFYFIIRMTSQIIEPQTLLQCPICLATLVLPTSLTCGHTFCEACIKSKYFSLVKQACPLCRKPIIVDLDLLQVNVILEQILNDKYGGEKSYQQRCTLARKSKELSNKSKWLKVKKWIREKLPWIIILILLYHLFKVKVNFFSFRFKDYKGKAISLANSIKVENSLDFKFLLFSQFMRLLFSTIVIP